MSIIVGIDGLGLEAGDGIELLDGGGTELGQLTEDDTLDFRDLSVLDGVDQGVLCGLGVLGELVGGVLLTLKTMNSIIMFSHSIIFISLLINLLRLKNLVG